MSNGLNHHVFKLMLLGDRGFPYDGVNVISNVEGWKRGKLPSLEHTADSVTMVEIE